MFSLISILCTGVKTDIITAWYQYYQQLLNPNLVATQLPEMVRNIGFIPPVHASEVKIALQKMSNKKAIEPDGIPVES